MAKLTKANLASLVNLELDASKIAQDAPFVANTDTITGLLVKIGKQYTLNSSFQDRLPELEGENLDFGSTVEEYFTDLRLPVADDPDGKTNMAPRRPSFQDVAYSYELDKYVSDTTVDTVKLKHAFLGQAEFSTFTGDIMKKLYDSQTLHKYFVKKQALGRFIENIPANSPTSNMITLLDMPANTADGETWIKQVKDTIEEISLLISERNNIRNVLARADELTLYVKPGLVSVIDVDVLAGAFNKDLVEIPVNIKVLEDFGTITGDNVNTWALLTDTRAVRVFPRETESDSDRNGQGGFTNFYLKEAYTAAYSKVVNAHIWVATE